MKEKKEISFQIIVMIVVAGFALTMSTTRILNITGLVLMANILNIIGLVLMIGGAILSLTISNPSKFLLIGFTVASIGIQMFLKAQLSMAGSSMMNNISSILGAILFFVGITITIFGRRKKSMKKMNKSTIATLTNIRQTGISRGRYARTPQVELTYEFYTDTGMQVTAKEYLYLDMVSLSQIHIGGQVHIRYQEDKPENVAYDRDANTIQESYSNRRY